MTDRADSVTGRAQRPMVRSDLAVVELDGEAVVYDQETGQVHHLNPSATVVFGLCDGEATMSELAGDIAAAFGEPFDAVFEQVAEVIGRFEEAGLLAGGETP